MSTDTRDLAERLASTVDGYLVVHSDAMLNQVAKEFRRELEKAPELREVREALEALRRDVYDYGDIDCAPDVERADHALAALDRITGKLP